MLAPFAVALGRMPEVRSRWRQFLVLGLLNAAVPFTLIAFAEIEITASLAAILNSTTVLFSALVAAAWIGDPLTGRKIFGVVLGITGVTVLLGLDPLPLNGPILLAVGASLGAALSYAISGTHIRKAFAGVRPLTLAIGQQSGAALLLLLPAAATLPGEAPSLPVALSALALAVLCTAGLPALLYPDRERRADQHAYRHLSRAGLRGALRRLASWRACRPGDTRGSGDYPSQRRAGHRH